MLGQVISLSGDSAARHAEIPEPFHIRLASLAPEWIGQSDLLRRLGVPGFPTDIDARLAHLAALVPDDATARRTVLIGRSSGARVASLFELRRPVAAVICLAYPFRAPGRVIEPERFGHLATLAVPTLIVQPVDDPYGGADITEHYALSPQVRVAFTQGDHTLALDRAERDRVAGLIRDFCGHALGQREFVPTRFDESFYLGRYPDVAKAVRAGHFASAWEHFDRCGRQEGRRSRLLA